MCQIDDIVYFTYFEEARSYYFDQLTPLLDHWPSQEEDQLNRGAVELTHTSFVMEQQVRDLRDHERIFATGKTVMVWCNYHTGRPTVIPPLLRAAFERMEGCAFPLPE